MKYETLTSNRWIYPRHNGYRMGCCDCGLVHELDFRVVRETGGKKRLCVKFRVRRNNRATAASRRGKKFAGLKLPRGRA